VSRLSEITPRQWGRAAGALLAIPLIWALDAARIFLYAWILSAVSGFEFWPTVSLLAWVYFGTRTARCGWYKIHDLPESEP
jgi:hypothetical protein